MYYRFVQGVINGDPSATLEEFRRLLQSFLVYTGPWNFVEFQKILWTWNLVEFRGIPWNSVELRGIPCNSVEFCGIPCTEFRGISWSPADAIQENDRGVQE